MTFTRLCLRSWVFTLWSRKMGIVVGDRISKREERHSDGPLVWPGAEFHGEHFWARGYAVSTLGLELEQVRKYIREPEAADGNRGSF